MAPSAFVRLQNPSLLFILVGGYGVCHNMCRGVRFCCRTCSHDFFSGRVGMAGVSPGDMVTLNTSSRRSEVNSSTPRITTCCVWKWQVWPWLSVQPSAATLDCDSVTCCSIQLFIPQWGTYSADAVAAASDYVVRQTDKAINNLRTVLAAYTIWHSRIPDATIPNLGKAHIMQASHWPWYANS